MIFGRSIAVWVGIAVAVALAVIQTLTGQGVISDAAAGKLTNSVKAIEQLLTLLAPVIAGLIIHPQVTPVSAPALPEGTTVTVITPDDLPNKQTTL